jgi:hypothetical protein
MMPSSDIRLMAFRLKPERQFGLIIAAPTAWARGSLPGQTHWPRLVARSAIRPGSEQYARLRGTTNSPGAC